MKTSFRGTKVEWEKYDKEYGLREIRPESIVKTIYRPGAKRINKNRIERKRIRHLSYDALPESAKYIRIVPKRYMNLKELNAARALDGLRPLSK